MIRLLIVDHTPVVRAGLRSILAGSSEIQIVGEAQDGSQAIERTQELLPDVLLMELRLPGSDGLSVLRTLHTRAPQAKVILFTASENKEDFIEAMKLGCCGILPKDADALLISKSIQKVYAGEIWLDSNTTAAVIRQFASPLDPALAQVAANAKPRERAQLSQREREIIVLIAQGYKNKEIAEKMFITEQTVKNHLHNVFDKLGVSDRLELALYAIHNSLHLKP
jgi:two-component system, NarL family, nitrate/nitrite response regulator NarL